MNNAEQAIKQLDDYSFDPSRAALVHEQEKKLMSQYQLVPAQYGNITYEKKT